MTESKNDETTVSIEQLRKAARIAAAEAGFRHPEVWAEAWLEINNKTQGDVQQ